MTENSESGRAESFKAPRARRQVPLWAFIGVTGIAVAALVLSIVTFASVPTNADVAKGDERTKAGLGLRIGGVELDVLDLETELGQMKLLVGDINTTVDSIDAFLLENELASVDLVESLGTYVDDLVSCINDNLDQISRGQRLFYCG